MIIVLFMCVVRFRARHHVHHVHAHHARCDVRHRAHRLHRRVIHSLRHHAYRDVRHHARHSVIHHRHWVIHNLHNLHMDSVLLHHAIILILSPLTQVNTNIKGMRSDKGSDCTSNEMKEWAKEVGMVLETVPPDGHDQLTKQRQKLVSQPHCTHTHETRARATQVFLFRGQTHSWN